jgi:hypothetical protein
MRHVYQRHAESAKSSRASGDQSDREKREVVIKRCSNCYEIVEEAGHGVTRSLSWPQAAEMSLPRDSRTSAV